MKKIVLISILLLNTTIFFSQSKRDANSNFDDENYRVALKQYLKLLKTDKNNEEYLYKIAVCYLNTNMDKTKAISYLEKLDDKGYYGKMLKFYLAQAYMHKHNFDKAISLFKEYKEENRKHITTEK